VTTFGNVSLSDIFSPLFFFLAGLSQPQNYLKLLGPLKTLAPHLCGATTISGGTLSQKPVSARVAGNDALLHIIHGARAK
jgi:hypothetical protein